MHSKTIDTIREFNRFYTVNMDFLNSKYLDSRYSIAETRILFEIKTNKSCTQNDIVKALHIDKSYLNRIIQHFNREQIIEKTASDNDKRTVIITLTEKGNEEADKLIKSTNQQIKDKIASLSAGECNQLCNALNTICSILGKEEI